MSNRRKGARTKRKCKEFFEDRGWQVGDVEKSSKYAKQRDLFDLFDLVAIKGATVKFIQVKTNRPAKQKPYREWAKEHCCDSIECVVATWYDYKDWRLQNYLRDGTIEEEDLR